jgi:aryl-alcohol dehydrogenase (NADP+)
MFETTEVLRPLVAEAVMSMVQMSVAWMMANPAITVPIIRKIRLEQLADSLSAAETPLPADLKPRLDELTGVPAGEFRTVGTVWDAHAPCEIGR